jgi:hypothetical protein
LIITDPHPRNYRHAWTFKDLSKAQLAVSMDYFGAAADRVIGEFQPDIIECQHIWRMDFVLEQSGYRYISAAHHSDLMGFRNMGTARPASAGGSGLCSGLCPARPAWIFRNTRP